MNKKPLLTLSFCLFFGIALAEETTLPTDTPPAQEEQINEDPRDDSAAKESDDAPAIADVGKKLENVPVGELTCETAGFTLRTSEDDSAARHADLSSARGPNSIGGVCMEANLEITHLDEARSVETPESSQ